LRNLAVGIFTEFIFVGYIISSKTNLKGEKKDRLCTLSIKNESHKMEIDNE